MSLTHGPRLTGALLLFALAAPAGLAQPTLQVVRVSPAPQALQAAPDASLVITFDAPVAPATLTPTTVLVYGRWSGVRQGTLTLEAGDTQVRFTPDRPFFAGERVTVSLSHHVATPDGVPLASGYAWQFWIRTRPASLALQETGRRSIRSATDGWIQSYGAYAGDFNEDGYSDLLVPNERSNDVRVFLNDGRGGYPSFTRYPIPDGARPSPNEGADFDRDGHIDVAVGNTASDRVSLFTGTGEGTFLPARSYAADHFVRGVAVLDLDADGYPDLVTANRAGSPQGNLALFLNNGDGSFAPATLLDGQGQEETAVEAADMNGDGVLDLVVGALVSRTISVFLGDGLGSLSFAGSFDTDGAVWMLTTGDLDGDGHVDVATANANESTASVLFGLGDGSLSAPTSYPTGRNPLAIDLGDLDGDGDLDLVTSNFGGTSWTLYENAGGGVFANRRTLPAAGAGSCAILHDRDNDGILDLTGIDEIEDLLFFFSGPALPIATEPEDALPRDTVLALYPNPFQSTLSLSLILGRPGPVRIDVYDLLGRRVRTLLAQTRPAGSFSLTWDGQDASGRLVSPGPYFLRYVTPTSQRTLSVVRRR